MAKKQRQNYEYIMELAEWFSKASQVKIQQCRLFLQVILLYEVCTPDGDKVDLEYYEGKKLRASRLHWTEQGNPDCVAWA